MRSPYEPCGLEEYPDLPNPKTRLHWTGGINSLFSGSPESGLGRENPWQIEPDGSPETEYEPGPKGWD